MDDLHNQLHTQRGNALSVGGTNGRKMKQKGAKSPLLSRKHIYIQIRVQSNSVPNREYTSN